MAVLWYLGGRLLAGKGFDVGVHSEPTAGCQQGRRRADPRGLEPLEPLECRSPICCGRDPQPTKQQQQRNTAPNRLPVHIPTAYRTPFSTHTEPVASMHFARHGPA